MTLLALIRHAPSTWSEAGRLQGRADPPLAAALPAWRLPAALDGFRILASPLRRAVETAHLLGVAAPTLETLLIEMAWGDWEGETLAGLRARLGTAMAEAEAAGLDFHPPGGESPRDVQERIAPLLAGIARSGEATAAITHKGVIRAIFARATGWDMRGKAPARLSWSAAHVFRLDRDGTPSVERLNLSLERDLPLERDHFCRHPRGGGDPGASGAAVALDSRFRGNDDSISGRT